MDNIPFRRKLASTTEARGEGALSFGSLPCCQGGDSLTDPKESSKLIYGLILTSAQQLNAAAALIGIFTDVFLQSNAKRYLQR